GGHQPPAFKRLAGRGYGIVHIALVGALKDADYVPCIRGIEILIGLAAAGLNPLATNEILEKFRRHLRQTAAFLGIKPSIVPRFPKVGNDGSSDELRRIQSWLSTSDGIPARPSRKPSS